MIGAFLQHHGGAGDGADMRTIDKLTHYYHAERSRLLMQDVGGLARLGRNPPADYHERRVQEIENLVPGGPSAINDGDERPTTDLYTRPGTALLHFLGAQFLEAAPPAGGVRTVLFLAYVPAAAPDGQVVATQDSDAAHTTTKPAYEVTAA